MAVIEIFVVLSLYIYVLFRLPEMRIAGTIIATVLIGGLLYYTITAPSVPEEEMNRIAVSEITIEDVDIALNPRVTKLKGRVINNSPTYALTGIRFDVKLYDCPTEDTPLTECFIIGEDSKEARLSAPPGQLRAFEASLIFANLPEIEGVLRWDYQINALRALEVGER
ncbi:MAG: hypothetical protein COB08_000865 [Rhodobacteraceae bacterium]|nr:hypothetical protein [Paracoccaceae bacterium]